MLIIPWLTFVFVCRRYAYGEELYDTSNILRCSCIFDLCVFICLTVMLRGEKNFLFLGNTCHLARRNLYKRVSYGGKDQVSDRDRAKCQPINQADGWRRSYLLMLAFTPMDDVVI